MTNQALIRPIILTLSTFILSLLEPQATHAAPAKNPVVCVAKKDGAISVKSKCTKVESRFAESSYSVGRTAILNVAPKGARFKTLAAAVDAAIRLNPSATNPVLIKLAPGRYDLQTVLTIPRFVTVEGAGIGTSLLAIGGGGQISLGSSAIVRRATITVSSALENGSAVGISTAESDVIVEDIAFTTSISGSSPNMIFTAGNDVILRNLSIENTTPSTGIFGVEVAAGTASLQGLRMNLQGAGHGVRVTGGSASVRGSTFVGRKLANSDSIVGIRATNSSATLVVDSTHIAIEGDDSQGTAALWASNNAQITARNSTFSVTGSTAGAVQADESGTAVIINCDLITAGTSPTGGAYSGGSISIGGSRLSGGAVFAQIGSTARCAGVYDEDFLFSASACL